MVFRPLTAVSYTHLQSCAFALLVLSNRAAVMPFIHRSPCCCKALCCIGTPPSRIARWMTRMHWTPCCVGPTLLSICLLYTSAAAQMHCAAVLPSFAVRGKVLLVLCCKINPKISCAASCSWRDSFRHFKPLPATPEVPFIFLLTLYKRP